jgi:probable addiction module antidote protein
LRTSWDFFTGDAKAGAYESSRLYVQAFKETLTDLLSNQALRSCFLKTMCPNTEMTEQFTRFDSAEFLKSQAEMAAYLEACVEEDAGDGVLIRAAINDIARALGLTQDAREIGLSRKNLNKA